MKKKLLLSVFTLLLACPTPPKNISNNGPAGQNPPNNPEGNNPDPNKNQTGNPPPQGNPPEQKTDGQEKPSDNPDAKDAPKQDEANKSSEQPPVDPKDNKPPEGGIITDSLLILVQRVSNNPSSGPSQEQVMKDKHVTFSGKAVCKDCKDPLVLRVVRFIGPNANPTNNDVITLKEISTGDFSIAVPKGEESVALELLVDSDKNGIPSIGERFAVIEMGGQLIPKSNKDKLTLDASDRDTFKQAPVPNGAPEK
jgi:hypothetical protein